MMIVPGAEFLENNTPLICQFYRSLRLTNSILQQYTLPIDYVSYTYVVKLLRGISRKTFPENHNQNQQESKPRSNQQQSKSQPQLVVIQTATKLAVVEVQTTVKISGSPNRIKIRITRNHNQNQHMLLKSKSYVTDRVAFFRTSKPFL